MSMHFSTLILLGVLLSPITFAWEESSGVLNVHVVPHSHNDPGWWYTFDDYYNRWTRGILTSVVEVLSEDRDRTFIWAEISYFQKWWDEQTDKTKNTVKRLVDNGQLEFVTAGWVMNDEANSHVVDIINQLTEGHEWLYKNLKTKPTIGWAIDPFGHSPTMPYVLQQMGFEAMVINRAHKEIKEEFRTKQRLEFTWTGDSLNSSADFHILTHMLPWKLYDIPNTCGPDWHVCAAFDFERDVAIPVTPQNVKERSETLVSMYKQKAQLFRHNSVLIPLGDDFKYKTAEMTRKIMSQYEMMFKHINSNPDLNVNIKFSTLKHYFAELDSPATFPSYQGDFFTYCDEGDDYWSGYFTTRPFMKGLTRSTQAIMRTGEILAALAHAHVGESVTNGEWDKWFSGIERARRNVALFQHHDGVTGTARREVVVDYANRLLSSLSAVAEHSNEMSLVVLSKSSGTSKKIKTDEEKLSWTTEPAKQPVQPITRVLSAKSEVAVVVIFNPLAHSRTEVVTVLVNNHEVQVTDSEGENVPSQVDPVWEDADKVSKNQFNLHFVAKISGIGFSTYFIQPMARRGPQSAFLASVVEYSSSPRDVSSEIVDGWNMDKNAFSEDNLKIKNSEYEVEVSGTGEIRSISRLKDKEVVAAISADQSFLSYSSHGGAYLFLPNGEGQPINAQTTRMTVVTGPLVETVHTTTNSAVAERTIRLYSCNPSSTSSLPSSPCAQADNIEVVHVMDLTAGDTEIVTRFKTNITTIGKFYTDSNGFDMREREYKSNLPIQGNYYPITSATFLESVPSPSLKNSKKGKSDDATVRFSILSHQAHGVASLHDGEIEIMLDRRLNRDDGRGLGESITDNVRTRIPLWLVVEPAKPQPFDHPTLSLSASDAWHARNYPLHTMYTSMSQSKTQQPHLIWGAGHHLTYEPLSRPFPPHLRLLTLSPRDKDSSDIILRVHYPPTSSLDEKFKPNKGSNALKLDMFRYLEVDNVKEMSLSLMYENNNKKILENEKATAVTGSANIALKPAEIRSFIVNLHPASATDSQDEKKIIRPTRPQKKDSSDLVDDARDLHDILRDPPSTAPKNERPGDEPTSKRPSFSDRQEVDDDENAIDDEEMVVPPVDKDGNQQKEWGQKNKGNRDMDDGNDDDTDSQHVKKVRNSGEGKVGRIGGGADVIVQNAKNSPASSTTGLYTMSIVFYLSLLFAVVGGGYFCRRFSHDRHSKRAAASASSAASSSSSSSSRAPPAWKERDDSLMKIL